MKNINYSKICCLDMKRILHIVGKMDRAGAESMIMNLYRAIDKEAFQFDFVVFTDIKGDFDDEIIALGGQLYRLLDTNPIKRLFALKNLLLSHSEYDIVHCHMLFGNAFHILAAKMADVSVRIAHAHNTQNRSKGRIVDLLYFSISRLIIKKFSTHFIGCGKAAAGFLFPRQKNVLFLPNSVDTVAMAEVGETSKDYWLKEFDVDRDVLKIIQVGRIEPVKNHGFSLRLARYLKAARIPFKMMFVGQGNKFQEVVHEVASYGLKEEILLPGIRKDISHLMAGANVMLMPSLHEGFPVVLVESQAVGLPALIADTISPEVDLGMGLVAFLSLNEELGIWLDLLKDLIRRQIMKSVERLEILKEKGFDILSNANLLAELYDNPDKYGKYSSR